MLPENWKELAQSSRNAVFATFVLIAMIAAYNWIIAPHRNYLRASQQRESVTNHLTKKVQLVRNNLKIKTKQLERMEEQFSLIRSRFFDLDEARSFLSDIQTLTTQANCTLSSMDFSPVKSQFKGTRSEADGGITANRAKLTIAGRYKNLVALIDKLQARPQWVLVDTISIASIPEDPGQLRCEASIMIYVIHDEETRSHD